MILFLSKIKIGRIKKYATKLQIYRIGCKMPDA